MLYEVILRSTYAGQELLNKWTYNSSGVPAAVSGSYGLAYAFGFVPIAGEYPGTALFGNIRNLVHNGTLFTNATIKALANYAPADFYEIPFVVPAPGYRTGEGLSPVLAIGFRSTRVRTDIRRATKRFGGVAEEDCGSGGTLTGSAISRANIVSVMMKDNLTYNDEGNTITYSPCVCSKEIYVDPEDGKTKRRYWATLQAQLARTALGINWEAYQQVRSQTSRQYGRGA
jgi:hypothetical protein